MSDRPSHAVPSLVRSLRLATHVLLAGILLCTAAARGAVNDPLLYEVTSDTTTVYLFGTIHVGAPSMYPLNAKVQAAFDRSQALALEADPTDQAAIVAAMTQALYAPPDSLERHIGPELYQQVMKVAPGYGLPVDYAKLLRPALLAMVLSMSEVQRLGYDAALGLDIHFAKSAKSTGKPIVQLESMAEQIAMFNGMPAQAQESMLRATLDGLSDARMAGELDELVAAWSKGDPDAMLHAIEREFEGLDEQTARTLFARVYDERNQAMAAKVDTLLRGASVHFVAIGAGHLAGPTGLPRLLEKMGFKVRRL